MIHYLNDKIAVRTSKKSCTRAVLAIFSDMPIPWISELEKKDAETMLFVNQSTVKSPL